MKDIKQKKHKLLLSSSRNVIENLNKFDDKEIEIENKKLQKDSQIA